MIEDRLKGKKFVASYSGGKDSVLAIYKAVNEGMVPLGLLTAYKSDAFFSWFHGMSGELLQKVSESLNIPLTLIRTTGEQYNVNFENALIKARDEGAQVCVFGDIDIAGHLEWCTERCGNTGLIPYFPLCGKKRKEVVYEFIDAGFSAIIKIVDTSRLPDDFLGQTLCREVIDEIEKHGADVCGEEGEYHTFVYNGPLFANKIDFTVKGRLTMGQYAVLDLGS